MQREIIVDNFAGGGGASTGIEMATGRSVDIAINHDPDAIKMHRANHPDTQHYCESVWDVDPREATKGRPVGLVWLSPDCKHFSKAKGGKPVEKAIRGLAWIAVRWAATVKPRVIMLENVEEFQTWGPLSKDGMPDPKQKGRTFKTFVNALRKQGYHVEWKELRACDYGAPTIRKRLFMIARRDGQPIVWPEPTHAEPNSPAVKSKKLLPWRTAAEIIDWSLPCPSIFGRKKPLAENTMRRIARGIKKFVIDNPNPFIIKVNHGSQDFRGQKMDEPLQTITAKNGWGIVTPFIARIGQTGFGGDRLQYDMEKPLTTITSKAEHLLVVPHVTKFRSGSTGHAVDEPLHTITSGSGSVRPAGAAHAMGMVAAFLTKYHGETKGAEARGQKLDDPLFTLDTSNRFSLATIALVAKKKRMWKRRLLKSGERILLGNKKFETLVTSHLITLRNHGTGQPLTEPTRTITAGGLHLGEVRSFLIKYYGTGEGQELTEPLHTVPTKDRFGLVTIQGQEYQIVDIGMRMLEPHELFAAQGFPPFYKIDRDADGKPQSKANQVARCGNSVPPPFAEHLVRANLPEMCQVPGGYTSVANLHSKQPNLFDEEMLAIAR